MVDVWSWATVQWKSRCKSKPLLVNATFNEIEGHRARAPNCTTKTGRTEDKRHGHYKQKTVEIHDSTINDDSNSPSNSAKVHIFSSSTISVSLPFLARISGTALILYAFNVRKLRQSLCVFVRNGLSLARQQWQRRWWIRWHFSGRLSFRKCEGVPFFMLQLENKNQTRCTSNAIDIDRNRRAIYSSFRYVERKK